MVLGSKAGLATRRGDYPMNNSELNHRLLTEAELIMEEVKRAFYNRSWNLVVRRAQEVVELSLKSLLKLMGVEYPKTHDVGDK